MVTHIIIAIVVGLIVGLIVTGSMKASLKSVRTQDSAVFYKRQAGLTLTRKQDIYLYKRLEKTAKPKQDQQKK